MFYGFLFKLNRLSGPPMVRRMSGLGREHKRLCSIKYKMLTILKNVLCFYLLISTNYISKCLQIFNFDNLNFFCVDFPLHQF